MAKMNKKSRPSKKEKRNPLHDDIISSANLDSKLNATKNRAKFIARAKKQDKKEEEYIEPKLSKKILDIARHQQQELENESKENEYDSFVKEHDEQDLEKYNPEIETDSEEEVEELEIDEEYDTGFDFKDLEEADREAMNKFLPEAPGERINLADLILAKIEQKTATDLHRELNKNSDSRPVPRGMNPKVVEVYTKVGLLLSRYKSGKLPKAFKIIPSLANWEEILYITRPEKWTPHAHYEAARIFVALNPKKSQRFFRYVLLDKVRQAIQDSKRLDPHLYMALKKSLFKPAAFFKGILFPLCESGNCTLREAVIIGSVLCKVSVPMLHSAAALLRLAEMEYSGSNSLFIRILLDKKYALPYKVIDSLVFHFIRFQNETELLPVLWHQAFLVFVQRYKQDLTPEQKSALLDVLRTQNHPAISVEIRREIVNSVSRGELLPEAQMELGMTSNDMME